MKEGFIKIENGEVISSSIPLLNLDNGKLSFPEFFIRVAHYTCIGDKLNYKPSIAYKDGTVTLTVPKEGNFNIRIGGY